MPAPHPQPRRPRSLLSRRAGLPAVALAAAAAVLATGCASFDAAMGKREAVVQFSPNTSNTVRLRVRAACSHIPNAAPEPLPTDHIASDILNDVRYRVDNASDADLARLQQCLQKFPSVVGVNLSAPSGM